MNWIQTYTGKKFYPTDPRVEDIDIRDIAHALSMTCRFGGHCKNFYSVAEHSYWLSGYVVPTMSLTALLHDASEAYITDIARPIKPYLSNYNELEDNLMACIAKKFPIIWPLPEEIKILDTRIVLDERNQLMSSPPGEWIACEGFKPLGIKISAWNPPSAEIKFLKSYNSIMETFYGG